MLGPKSIDDLFMGSVTVGERGQVVIPAKAREALGVAPGEKLLVFLHPEGDGVAFAKVGMLAEAAATLKRLAEQVADEPSQEDVS